MSLLDRMLRRTVDTVSKTVWDKPDLEAVPNGWNHPTTLQPTRISFELTHDRHFRKAFIWGVIKDGSRGAHAETVATIDSFDALPDWVREDFFED